MVMGRLRPVLLLLLASAFIVIDDIISEPSCEISGRDVMGVSHRDDLKVMMVADLLLLGSDAGYADSYFRDPFKSKFLRKSLERLKPDLLIVLGDISAKGWQLPHSKWLAVLRQFHAMLGPFFGLPLHIVFGDRDIGECSKLDEDIVSQTASSLPGLDSAGCSVFEISNISFISLNSVAMLCGNNDLRFGVEKVVERESVDLLSQMKGGLKEVAGPSDKITSYSKFKWRENNVKSGSGPVLLLHFPLYQRIRSILSMTEVLEEGTCDKFSDDSRTYENSALKNSEPYELNQTLPANATEYIFQALKPRIVFSAHAQNFCDRIHPDGTREVTLPAMSWAARGKPGFIVVTFRRNETVSVSHCSLAVEWHVISAYACIIIFFIATLLVMRWTNLISVVGC